MSGPPTGTVTFLFTDIESSTRLWEQGAPAMHKALARHDEIVRDTIAWHGGYVFKTIGDAFCATFPSALEAALSAQRALSAEAWSEEIGALRIRMALHVGAAEERDGASSVLRSTGWRVSSRQDTEARYSCRVSRANLPGIGCRPEPR